MLVSDGNRLAHHLKGLSCRQQLSSRSRATAKCHASEAALKQEVTSTPWDAQMPLSLGARTVFARLMKSFSLTPATHVLTTACTTNLKTLKLICSRLLERLGGYSVCVCERESLRVVLCSSGIHALGHLVSGDTEKSSIVRV